jgi:hypothetical protein
VTEYLVVDVGETLLILGLCWIPRSCVPSDQVRFHGPVPPRLTVIDVD